MPFDNLNRHPLDAQHALFIGPLPAPLQVDEAQFEQLWMLHPSQYHAMFIHGRMRAAPRWQQNYGVDYYYSGQINAALPLPTPIAPFLRWCRETIEAGLNGVLLNWYDGALGHYMGKHRDSTKNMLRGAPIVTISLGESRIFRLRPWKGRGFIDFPVHHGSVVVIPFATNQCWTHEVPTFKKHQGRRISVTLRALFGTQDSLL